MYRPRISPEKLKKLYYIKRRLGIPMTEVLEMAIDSNDNIIAFGNINGSAASTKDREWMIMAFSSSGTQLWNHTYASPAGGANESEPNSIALDSNDNVIVAGYERLSIRNRDWKIMAFSSSGTIVEPR